MGGGDLAGEVSLHGRLIHRSSIERALTPFNARRRRRTAWAAAGLLALGTLPRSAAAYDLGTPAGALSVGGYLDGRAVAATAGGPEQHPGALLALRFDAAPERWLAGHVELRTRLGGPVAGEHGGVHDFDHTFQSQSPSLEFSEAYADLRSRQAELRLGVQKFAWGKLDGIPPTDVLNPRDYHDLLVDDVEEAKIGVPAARLSYFLPDLPRLDLSGLGATLVYVPLAVSARLPLLGERWFPSTAVSGGSVQAPPLDIPVKNPTSGKITTITTEPYVLPLDFGTANHRPSRGLADGGIAFRLGGQWRDVDWDLYHYTGPETGPDADLGVTLTRRCGAGGIVGCIRIVGTPTMPRFKIVNVRAKGQLRQTNDTIHMTGGDWAAAFGGFTVRAEAAYFQDRPYLRVGSDLTSEVLGRLRRKLQSGHPPNWFNQFFTSRRRVSLPIGALFPERDSVEWGLGADYLVQGFLPLLQVNQVVLLEPAPRLAIADPETKLIASVRKRYLGDRLELEVRGVYAIERQSWFVLPRVSYLVRDALRLRLGYLAIGGDPTSLIGQYRDNDEVILEARYTF